MIKFKKIFYILFAIVFSSVALKASAAAFVLDGVQCIEYGNCTPCDFVRVLINITDMIIAYSGLIALVMIIFGGALMLTAWGKEERVAMGKKTVTAAFVGIFIVFVAWTLINTIVMATVGLSGGGFGKVVSFANGGRDSTDWNRCPSGGNIEYDVMKERADTPKTPAAPTPDTAPASPNPLNEVPPSL